MKPTSSPSSVRQRRRLPGWAVVLVMGAFVAAVVGGLFFAVRD